MRKSLLCLLLALPAFGADLAIRLDWLLVHPLEGLPVFHSATPPTLASAKLGRLLFFDKRLSRDQTISCASCHRVDTGFSENRLPVGIGGAINPRKAPPTLNRAFFDLQFWDGRAGSLEAQVAGPLTGHVEMGNTVEAAVATLSSISGYSPLFRDAFGDSRITSDRLFHAVADYERTLLSGSSRFDRWNHDPSSVSFTDAEKRGYELYNDRECHICHAQPFFTDNQFHNSGVGFVQGKFLDEGRGVITHKAEDRGAFKTPSLRDVATRAPYMHDGSLPTLEAVIDFYNEGGHPNPSLSQDITELGLSPSDRAAIVAFLKTLDGEGHQETEPLPGEYPQ